MSKHKDCKPLPVPDHCGEYDLPDPFDRALKYIVRVANDARTNANPLTPKEVYVGIIQACEDSGIDLSQCADAADVQAVVMAYLMAGRKSLEHTATANEGRL